MTRRKVIESVRQLSEVSVLIIGAGVNGIGTFRELALQGVDVLLVDKGDFCSGASAASSHMLHGGLKYLENGEFRLVREALAERNRLLQNAAHYARPLPTTVPIFRWFSGLFNAPLKFLNVLDNPGERGAIVIKLGLMMYDFFVRSQRTMPKHTFTARAKSLERYPEINPNILYTATYYDGWISCPERLCLDMILDAEAAAPHAHALNYVSIKDASGDCVQLQDEISGEVIEVRPRVVINAAGPWIDFVNRAMKLHTQFIGGTKGSHLVVDCPRLLQAVGDHEFYFENRDGRICLILPFFDRVMIGSTDIRVDDPGQARCTDDEVDYLINSVKMVFPDIALDRTHIVFWFSGVRPLPASDAAVVGQISRDHSIKTVEPGDVVRFPIYSLVGGKWTTFRAFSEQVADVVLKRLGLSRKVHTQTVCIGGGKHYPRTEQDCSQWVAQLANSTGLSQERTRVLFKRYGTRAQQIARFIAGRPDSPLTHAPDYTRLEFIFLAQEEKVIHLDDLILRRTLMAMLGKVTPNLLEELAEVLREALGWSDKHTRSEITRTTAILKDHHGVILDGQSR